MTGWVAISRILWRHGPHSIITQADVWWPNLFVKLRVREFCENPLKTSFCLSHWASVNFCNGPKMKTLVPARFAKKFRITLSISYPSEKSRICSHRLYAQLTVLTQQSVCSVQGEIGGVWGGGGGIWEWFVGEARVWPFFATPLRYLKLHSVKWSPHRGTLLMAQQRSGYSAFPIEGSKRNEIERKLEGKASKGIHITKPCVVKYWSTNN